MKKFIFKIITQIALSLTLTLSKGKKAEIKINESF